MAKFPRRRETAEDDKRVVLAFDAGCMTCSALARRIEERVGHRLELRSLSSPQVREWRKRALGEDAPWAPTLIELKGREVKAWTGPGMALRLSRSLGPVASWRVMQILGEFGSEAASERWGEHPVAGALARAVSRGQFLKGAGGVVAGAAVLAGFGWVPLSIGARSHTAQAQTQEPTQGCDFKEPAYSYKELTGAERDAYVNNNLYYNPHFNILWYVSAANGFKPRPDKARVITVTYTSGGVSRSAYDLRVPFERVGQQYPVLSVTANASAANTSMAVFQRVSETGVASRVDIYRGDRQRRRNGSFYWRVVYTRSWQGPFPLVDAPVVAQEVTPSSSGLLAPEGTTSEVSPVSSPKVAPSEVVASEATTTTTLSPEGSSSCEDCAKFVEAVGEYTCYGLAEIGCALVCFEPGQYVDLSSCEPQCGAVIAAVCAAGVPADEGTACSPFCDLVELTGEELVEEARRAALSQDMLNVGPGAYWSAGMQVGSVSEACKDEPDGEDVCVTFICHNPALGCNSRWEGDDLNIAPGSTAIKAFRHRCSDGNTQLAISFLLSGGLIYHYYEYDQPADGVKTEAGRWEQKDGTTEFRRTGFSHNDRLAKRRRTAQARNTMSTAQFEYSDCLDPVNSAVCGCCEAESPENRYEAKALIDVIDAQCLGDEVAPNPTDPADEQALGALCSEECTGLRPIRFS